ncbi:MAG TPA: glycosyltransferase, partial [Myxococcaceae bacterium]|nr:glycosyltransferase [Myxococcaceae bacterium]
VNPTLRPPEDRAALRRELGLDDGPIVGMVSTFQPSRRHDVGIAAFARLRERVPEARLVLVGDGELEPRLRAQVEGLGLTGAVTFAGYRAGAEFMRWLQALDEVWVLGLGNDHSGRAAAQARACGVRVVAVEEGGLGVLADTLVEPVPDSVAAAALGPERRQVALVSNEDIARKVLALYEGAR